MLAEIWKEVLELQHVGIHDNFFHLGGHSLLAVRLMARIQEEFNRTLPLTELFQRPTVGGLAVLLSEGRTASSYSPLVPIRADGSRLPIFLIYPAGTMCYYELADQLGADQPVYGLEEPDSAQAPQDSVGIEALAARYRAALQEIQPVGPYSLGGWSLGGVVAFEVARQLSEQGEQVGLLALIDTRAPGHPDYDADSSDEFPASNPEIRHHGLEPLRLLPPEISAEHVNRFLAAIKSHTHAVRNYALSAYSGTIVLLRAADAIAGEKQDEIEAEGDSTLGWQQTGATIVVHWLPGNHFEIMERAHVGSVAEILKSYLAGTPVDGDSIGDDASAAIVVGSSQT
jgi:thioesterase domain-containing protein/acyl carrier protein